MIKIICCRPTYTVGTYTLHDILRLVSLLPQSKNNKKTEQTYIIIISVVTAFFSSFLMFSSVNDETLY